MRPIIFDNGTLYGNGFSHVVIKSKPYFSYTI